MKVRMETYMQKKIIEDMLLVLVGSFFISIGINMFFLPNHIVSGGMNGVSIIINYLTGTSPSTFLFLTNIPLLLISYLFLGKGYTAKTIFGAFTLPFFVYLTAGFPVATKVPLLAALFGGLVTGFGLGVVFRGKASTGGTAILSQIVAKYAKIPLGVAVGIVDGLVIAGAFVAFSADTVMFSLISLFIISRMIDLVQLGFNRSKNVFIISKQYAALKPVIIQQLDNGVTTVPVLGGFENQAQEMLMCVISEKRFPKLKETVLQMDPQAFVVVMSASEVMGLGFSLTKEKSH